MCALVAALALSACASGPQLASVAGAAAPAASAQPAPISASTSGPERDLSSSEKKVIMAAVADNLKDPQTARYNWTKIPARTGDSARNYCATVNAKSPYAAYDGKQAYIVELRLANGQIVGATMGLIAGGKDTSVVSRMCAKYGLDPNKST